MSFIFGAHIQLKRILMWTCKACNVEIDEPLEVCWNCSRDKTGNLILSKEDQQEFTEVKKELQVADRMARYPVLQMIVKFYRILAAILAVIALSVMGYAFSESEHGIALVIPILLVAGILILNVLAAAERIKVWIDIEYNTRRQSKMG